MSARIRKGHSFHIGPYFLDVGVPKNKHMYTRGWYVLGPLVEAGKARPMIASGTVGYKVIVKDGLVPPSVMEQLQLLRGEAMIDAKVTREHREAACEALYGSRRDMRPGAPGEGSLVSRWLAGEYAGTKGVETHARVAQAIANAEARAVLGEKS